MYMCTFYNCTSSPPKFIQWSRPREQRVDVSGRPQVATLQQLYNISVGGTGN